MRKRYWWTKVKLNKFRNLKALQDCLLEGNIIYLYFDNNNHVYLLNSDTFNKVGKTSSDKDYMQLWNFYYGWRSHKKVTWWHKIEGGGHSISEDESFEFKIMTKEEFNNFINEAK